MVHDLLQFVDLLVNVERRHLLEIFIRFESFHPQTSLSLLKSTRVIRAKVLFAQKSRRLKLIEGNILEEISCCLAHHEVPISSKSIIRDAFSYNIVAVSDLCWIVKWVAALNVRQVCWSIESSLLELDLSWRQASLISPFVSTWLSQRYYERHWITDFVGTHAFGLSVRMSSFH